jgi:aerobic-type carbon monoxide dehydrogenase small subunit (CoxS/CutS family)
MSGNICRCSAYPQILEAIRDVAGAAAGAAA